MANICPRASDRARRGGAAALIAATLIAAPAFAERTDRDKPINIEADRVTVDDAKQIATFEGKVRLTQGSLTIIADRVVVTQDQNGYQHATAWGAPASFRQKRENADEYIEGWGQRMEYDGRNDLLELFNQARVRRGQDEVRGNYISYNSVTEFFQAQSAKTGSGDGDARVRAVIQPKPNTPPQGGAPPVTIKPSASITPPAQ
jgi:lipopolysaccharide export system protein LptA